MYIAKAFAQQAQVSAAIAQAASALPIISVTPSLGTDGTGNPLSSKQISQAIVQQVQPLGIQAFGASRAFPYEIVLREKLVKDHVGPEPIILVVGPDNQSVRAFRTHQDFYRTSENGQFFLMDASTGCKWNFQGCVTEGKSLGSCLEPVYVIKDYWFDWRNYNPTTTIYTH